MHKKWAPALIWAIYLLGIYLLGGFARPQATQYYVLTVLVMGLAYGGDTPRKILKFIFPVIFAVLIYDSFFFFSKYIQGRIHVAEPYLLEKALFGINTEAGRLTLNEWFAQHTYWLLDFIAGLVYFMYVLGLIIIAAIITIQGSRKGTRRHSKEYISARTPAILWAFFWCNMVGYTTWHVYPAAPPWYVALYGTGPANPTTSGNCAGLIRFDQLLGIHFFENYYAQSNATFGAIPSLHCAYALLTAFYAIKFGSKLRGVCIIYYLLMVFSAVYLNHHYVIDIILGSIVGIMGATLTDLYFERKIKRSTRQLIQSGPAYLNHA